jgi:cytochrome c-type protein NapB
MKKFIITTIAALAVSSSLMAAVNSATCKGCHGANFEKQALGRSEVVADMTHDEIAKQLLYYKTTTVPAEMIMKGQIGRYSDAELTEFSKTVGK